ncbi:transglutaminase-like domain-containing protein [Clostridium sp. BJN0001]|uniref:transglutaminase-like domain-containing protein n=1 Tax=Clostridium sp. BJN0001 TaxID=2930219 RepID=UPI001FD2CC20|nr:transglutaminase-like domain-containing protein [Clostridium sp. BJN0001]
MDFSNISYTIIAFIMLFAIIKTVITVLHTSDIRQAMYPIMRDISSFISFIIIVLFYDKFYEFIKFILSLFSKYKVASLGVMKLAGLVIVFFLIRICIKWILFLINEFVLKFFINFINGSKIISMLFGMLLGVIRGMTLVFALFIPIAIINCIPQSPVVIDVFDNMYGYDKVLNIVNTGTSKIIQSGLTKDVKNNKIILYNGVTIEDGVKSNSEIDNKAKTLVSNYNTDREKAKKLYTWVGSNIKYDDSKAQQVINSEDVKDSGAISAFETRKGICFDYACLYAAMSKAVGLKVRVITGQANNGQQFISHAWNEVYLNDEKKWIKVDPTFYSGGNYFDNSDFDEIHKKENIAGEF